MLEHGVQSDDLKIRMLKELESALRLGRAVSDASGTQHLKCMQENRPTPKAG